MGKGVSKAVDNVNSLIAEPLINQKFSVTDQVIIETINYQEILRDMNNIFAVPIFF